ncbi:MAG: hypothetical protein JWO60_1320, partial [Frankiales bacterium]|nr:hypothetical protein [Frankiales bacterium]
MTAEAVAPPRPRRLRRVVQLLGVAAVVAALGWVVLFSSLLDVERVAVTGASRATPAQVLAAAAVTPG